ncbi:MAG: LysR family transcriptional regulator [Gammaproteobacteria bacterium]|uniref:LysR family transcriptional regulator n=1 Tax=Hydrogenophaga sp. TaxID=1904254 RepID=UPI0025C1855F|nr:LysR substrate-binding domain-containing protein [Hydrogenophaga sp.]MBU4182562.1 LysR family transcriptional regulator [Gammaproteobacteria bacterium]MBU4279960.1 LysR family transcriptional regulator [Gammaproteobacteria bacterium]MBU4325404.1 LysR family transcriptional regulator [Gammaproteobacteria bacterium]MBU4508402.1 LysR family transcriptional regulator [Gammaproteobacteria bacterium]MCG2657382.1 LysR substrate-binding domain-containing protein [Hydrogenophaga sp.]
MRLRHIEVFNAVMLTGSVSAAARMINVTQPAVSRTLQHAELQLGFQLFQREGGRLRPTVEAQALYPHIERLFNQLEDVQRLSASLKAGRGKGELRVLTVLALSYEIFPRAMRLFREKHPAVVVHHEALHSPQIVSSLVLQEADVGYVFSAVSHPALAQEQLAQRRVVCVVPKGLLPARQVKAGTITLAQLSKLPVIALDGQDPLGILLAHAVRDSGTGLQEVMTVQTYHVALALAHHGVGVALVEGCTAASADPERVDVLMLEPELPTTVHMLRPMARPNSLTSRAFTRCMQQALLQVG